MPVARGHDQVETPPPAINSLTRHGYGVPVGHGQRSAFGEVVLEVHDHEGRAPRPPIIGRCRSTSSPPSKPRRWTRRAPRTQPCWWRCSADPLAAVFTERRADLRRHAGEISFPGGRQDEPDEDLRTTALREAEEEIGLPASAVDVVGALPPVGTFVTGYRVFPSSAPIESGHVWKPAEAEVARVLEFSLADLVAGHEMKRLVRKGVPIEDADLHRRRPSGLGSDRTDRAVASWSGSLRCCKRSVSVDPDQVLSLPACPLRAGPSAMRAASRRRQPAPPRTSPATRRCWRSQREPRASPARPTTPRSTPATSSSHTSSAARSTRSPRRLRALRARPDRPRRRRARRAARPAGPAARRREGLRPDRRRSTRSRGRRRPRWRGAGRSTRTSCTRSCASASGRPDALVQGLREPPRRADAVALRDGEGGRPARLRAPLPMGKPGRTPAASEAVRRFLGFYGPAKPGDFAEWAGLAKPHAQRLWDEVAGELAEVRSAGARPGSCARTARARVPAGRGGHPPDPAGRPVPAEAQPPAARPGRRAAQAAVPARREPRRGAAGRPPGRPVAGQGEGAKGGAHRRDARPPPRAALEEEAERVAELRGAAEAELVLAVTPRPVPDLLMVFSIGTP